MLVYTCICWQAGNLDWILLGQRLSISTGGSTSIWTITSISSVYGHLLPSRQLGLNTAWTKIEHNKHWLWMLLLYTVRCMMGNSYCALCCPLLNCMYAWKAYCAMCALGLLLWSLWCVLSILLCVNAVITAVHCVFTVYAMHCLLCTVCVRFPAPLMPVNRELVGRGQFLKYRHQPLLSMSPAGGYCPWRELPYNWQCCWKDALQWLELCCRYFSRKCKSCVSLL